MVHETDIHRPYRPLKRDRFPNGNRGPIARGRFLGFVLIASISLFAAASVTVAILQANTYLHSHDREMDLSFTASLDLERGERPLLFRDSIEPSVPATGSATATHMIKQDLDFSLPDVSLQRPGRNPLANMPIRYLIGANSPGKGQDQTVTVVAYDIDKPVAHGVSVAYCNLFDETNSGNYGPYLTASATAAQYNEGQIDPRGAGWDKNLREQFERRRASGFEYVDLDNPDAYEIKDVLGAIDLAATYGLKVIAKNPGLLEPGALAFVRHPNVYGIVVEEGAGSPEEMEQLRQSAGKPNLPVWFIAYGDGRKWADETSATATRYAAMGVTYSTTGEYANAQDLVSPADQTRVAFR